MKTNPDTHTLGLNFLDEDTGWILTEKPAYKADSKISLMFTEDGGRTWSDHPFPDSFRLETLKAQIPMEFVDAAHGWILSLDGLMKTNDGGKTWTYCN